MTSTHPLFPLFGYELREKTDNLYLGTKAPAPGQLDPMMGIFYVNMEGDNLSYVVKNPTRQVVTNVISLQEMQDALGNEAFKWPSPFSLDPRKYKGSWYKKRASPMGKGTTERVDFK